MQQGGEVQDEQCRPHPHPVDLLVPGPVPQRRSQLGLADAVLDVDPAAEPRLDIDGGVELAAPAGGDVAMMKLTANTWSSSPPSARVRWPRETVRRRRERPSWEMSAESTRAPRTIVYASGGHPSGRQSIAVTARRACPRPPATHRQRSQRTPAIGRGCAWPRSRSHNRPRRPRGRVRRCSTRRRHVAAPAAGHRAPRPADRRAPAQQIGAGTVLPRAACPARRAGRVPATLSIGEVH